MRSLIVTSLLMATVPVSAADCGSPTQWAEAFYIKHYHFMTPLGESLSYLYARR